MFRLAPLLATAVALNDETALMQGVKPQQVSTKDDKSKSVSNLLETAKTMLKNGATEDVVTFATVTMTEIMNKVLPAIESSHAADQKLITDTYQAFPEARAELLRGNQEIKLLYEERVRLSAEHKTCRGTGNEDREGCTNEYCVCEDKRDCDYQLYAIWKRFVTEESILRDHSDVIEGHFCLPGANGTTEKFRAEAVIQFDPWLIQKPKVEEVEVEYDAKVPVCETKYKAMDDKTDHCDTLQGLLEKASCAYANKVVLVKNTFFEFWDYQIKVYNDLSEEVHCLEIDRWKEWRALKSVECLLDATSARNGRPCDEETDEADTEITKCEQVQYDTDIAHLKIEYPHPCVPPPECEEPDQDDLNCIPVEPNKPCSQAYKNQEYADLWEPPANPFSETNSHCNARQECEECDVVPASTACAAFTAHGWPVMSKPEPADECKQRVRGGELQDVTKDQLKEGDFGGRNNDAHDGHFDPNQLD